MTQRTQADCWFHNGDDVLKPIWYQNPQATPFELWEFKHPCSNIRRYNGGLDWTLIHHLALGVRLCAVRFGTDHLAKLIAGYYASHDLHETIVGDMVSGMKKHVPEYNRLENMWEVYVHDQIGLPLDRSISPRAVRELDLMALVMEMTCLKHPAAHIAVEQTGIEPTAEWTEIFWEVQRLNSDECWDLIVDAINTAREELNGDKSSSNKDRHCSPGRDYPEHQQQ